MPNPLNTQDRLSQNGHYPSSQGLSQELLDFNKPNQTSATELKSSESVSDDWSSLTKELIDTLPRVWTRGLLYFLVLFAVIVLPWATLSKVDETGSARGRLEPKGKTLKLDAPVAGTVAAIKVKEGQTVKAGQILLELESDITRTELQQAQAKLEGLRNRGNMLELVKNQLQSEQLAQLDQIRQRLNSSKKAHALEKNRLHLANKDMQRHRYLWQQGVISKQKLEEVEGVMIERQGILEQVQSDIQQATSELEKQESIYGRQLKEYQSQIVDLGSEIAQTQKLIQSLQFQLQQRVLQAPTNGTIFQLSVNNAGTVLQPGQAITQIAPQGSPLVFRAQIPSSESGFLRVGQPVKLKFDAYPFQDYGVVQGHLRWISPDSKVEETPQGKLETFELEIALEQTYIQTQNKRVALTPGQTATAEVIVRQRHLIDFILDPFKKLQKGGVEL
jgi:HlyD family secretion protein